MNRLFKLIVPSVFCAFTAFGQSAPTLEDITRLPLPEGSSRPVLSNDGATLLFSKIDGTTLNSYDMDNGVILSLDDSAAAGIDPVFTTDSRKVIYRTATRQDGLTLRDVREVELRSGKVTVTEAPSRKRLSLKALPGNKYAMADYDRIIVSDGITISELKPLADAYSYIEAKLSPDAQKIAFIEPFKGVFVANADGSNPVNVAGKVSQICWINNHSLAMVVSHDDGYIILTSVIMYLDLNSGESVALTSDEIMPDTVTFAPETSTMVFSTVDGGVYSARLTLNAE